MSGSYGFVGSPEAAAAEHEGVAVGGSNPGGAAAGYEADGVTGALVAAGVCEARVRPLCVGLSPCTRVVCVGLSPLQAGEFIASPWSAMFWRAM